MITFINRNYPRLRLPLWAVLTLPFIFLLAATIGITGFLALRNSQNVVHDMAGKILDEITGRIDVHLTAFLQTPHHINQSNANLIRLGLLDSDDQDNLRRYLWEQVQIHDSVTSIYFGNTQGGIVTSGREGADGSLYVMLSDNFAAGPLHKYATDSTGSPTDTLVDIAQFDGRTRPWYEGALARDGENWSPPYVLSTGQDLAIAASYPVYAESGELLGVTSVDLFFSHVSTFLHDLSIGQTGQAYIVDQAGLLIATSTDTPTCTIDTDNGSSTPKRISAIDCSDSVVAATAKYIIDQYGAFPERELNLRVTINGEDTYLRTTPYHDPRGLDWMIIITIPERDFLAQIDDHNRVTIGLSILALLLAGLVGIVTVLQVLRPLTRLNNAATLLGQDGRWADAVPVTGPREIQQLGQTFNKMAGHLHGLITHLEERVKERTQEVYASEARYRAIVEDQTELICRFTPDNVLTFVNGAYCRYYGKTRAELIGSSFMPSIPEDEQAGLAEQLATLTPENPVVVTEHHIIRAGMDGQPPTLRWMQWVNRRLVNESEGRVEHQAVGRDITEQKQLALTLQKALNHEIELNQLKTDFISTVSHEFRTPMTIILSARELLERYAERISPEKQNELFRQIDSQIARMVSLLDDVFAINQAQRGRAKFSPKSVNLLELCEAAIHEVRTSAEYGVEFVFASSGVCVEVTVDESLIKQVMINLISNAAKYSQPGGTITISLTCSEEHVEFTVHDDGIGIPEEAHAQIFAPFFRANNIGTRPGTGLGLTIAKQSVDLHGGTITFESEEGKGTTFVVILPDIAFLEKKHAEDFDHRG